MTGPNYETYDPFDSKKNCPFQGPRKFFVGQNISKCRREYYRSTCVKLSGTPNYFFQPMTDLEDTPKNAQMSQTQIQDYV